MEWNGMERNEWTNERMNEWTNGSKKQCQKKHNGKQRKNIWTTGTCFRVSLWSISSVFCFPIFQSKRSKRVLMIASVIVIKDCFVGCFKFTTSPDFADIPPGTPKKHKIVISGKKTFRGSSWPYRNNHGYYRLKLGFHTFHTCGKIAVFTWLKPLWPGAPPKGYGRTIHVRMCCLHGNCQWTAERFMDLWVDRSQSRIPTINGRIQKKKWVDYNDLIVRYHEFHGFAVPQITWPSVNVCYSKRCCIKTRS